MKEEKKFIQLTKAWYHKSALENRDFVEEVALETSKGEINIRWYELTGEKAPVPKLEVFEDSWGSLVNDFMDVLQLLSKVSNKNIQPTDFCKELKKLGFKDITPKEKEKKTLKTIPKI